jgi:hypothetical protein
MKEHYDKEAEATKKISGKGKSTVIDSSGNIKTPEHLSNIKPNPTYVTKASKK